MNLALVGLDDQTLGVVRAALAGSEHRIVAVSDLSAEQMSRLVEAGAPARAQVGWETLLVDSAAQIDAVVVAAAGTDEAAQTLRAEQLTRLVQAGTPLLVSHPALRSMLACYELEMIREETRAPIVPLTAARWHPLAERAAALVREGATSKIGAVQQLVFERFAVRRERAETQVHFARDVGLIRRTCGDVARVGALGSMNDPTAYANLAVQLSGPEAISSRWSIGPVTEFAGARATFFGERGRLVLQMPDNSPWQLNLHVEGQPPESSVAPDWNLGDAALVALADAIRRRTSPRATGDDGSAWNDAARDVELAETVDRSLLRGRTIEVHREEHSEAGTFKGLMTSLGCGLLLVTIFLIFLLEVAGKVARWLGLHWLVDALQRWPLILLIVLLVFLLVQLLLKVATPRDAGAGDSEPNDPKR